MVYLKVRVTWFDGGNLDWLGHAFGRAAWDGRVRYRWIYHVSRHRQVGPKTASGKRGESKARASCRENDFDSARPPLRIELKVGSLLF